MREIAIDLDLEPLEEGGFVATSPDVPGLVAQGDSIDETVEVARALVAELAKAYAEFGGPTPAILRDVESGPVNLHLRVPVALP